MISSEASLEHFSQHGTLQMEKTPEPCQMIILHQTGLVLNKYSTAAPNRPRTHENIITVLISFVSILLLRSVSCLWPLFQIQKAWRIRCLSLHTPGGPGISTSIEVSPSLLYCGSLIALLICVGTNIDPLCIYIFPGSFCHFTFPDRQFSPESEGEPFYVR